jgi:hypothetical protein
VAAGPGEEGVELDALEGEERDGQHPALLKRPHQALPAEAREEGGEKSSFNRTQTSYVASVVSDPRTIARPTLIVYTALFQPPRGLTVGENTGRNPHS